MKKGINVFWIVAVLISVAILILSCFECVIGISYSGIPISSTMEPHIQTNSLFSLISIPTVVSVLLLFSKSKGLNVFACVIVLLQSTVVTFAHKLYKTIDAVFSNIAGYSSYEYNLTKIGILLSVLCWILFLVTIVLTIGRFRENRQTKINLKTNRIIIAVLSIILALVSFPVLMFRVMIVVDVSVVFGLVFFLMTAAVIFFAYYFPIKMTIKTSNRNYLWIMVFVIVIFLIQIVFKNQILDIWNDLFATLIGPGSIPSPLEEYR